MVNIDPREVVVLGVDPGQKGGFVSLNHKKQIVDKGTFELTKGGDLDFKAYIDRLRALSRKPTVAYLEEIHSIYGASSASTFSFGRSYQMAIDGLILLGVDVRYVQPKVWQRVMVTVPVRTKFGGGKDTKGMALDAARMHFPGEGFLRTPRSRTPHDGLVDAALIALYGLSQSISSI